MIDIKIKKNKVNSNNLSVTAYDIIKELILTLELKPKEIITETDLSELLGISRTPIRSALQRLAMESLVEITPNKSTFVADLSIDNYFEIFQVRESLELLSVKLATLNCTDSEIEQLKDMVEMQDLMSQNMEAYTRDFMIIDRSFHLAVAEFSHNKLLKNEIMKINELYYRYNHYACIINRIKLTVSEHRSILGAIEKRDSMAAEKYMKEHLNVIKDGIVLSLINRS